MTGGLAALILLSTASLLQTAEVPHLISLTAFELGSNATFQCPFSRTESRFFHWYKQSLGKMIQTVATVVYEKIEQTGPFKNTRFKVYIENDTCFITIYHVNKDDEGTYFCQSGTEFLQDFVDGFFLAVNDYNQQTSVYVRQTPETSSVQLGDTVTLQCSLFSKNKENRVECPGNHSVHWFRGGSGRYHPSIIYRNFIHRNSTDEEVKRSCVYRLSKTIQNSSDAGTYYCAVVTCGEILFGEGSKVETGPELNPVVLVLGGILVCCVTAIAILISCITGRNVCTQFKGAKSVSHSLRHAKSAEDQSNDLDGEANAVNYAPLVFSMRKMKGKTRSEYKECAYSVVRAEEKKHEQLSL